MNIICDPFSCPKEGASEAQNDDAYMTQPCANTNMGLFRCAVADGATESLFAGKWAARLAKAYSRGHFTGQKKDVYMQRLQRSWTTFLHSKQLPWYAAAKAEDGSFATLIGLELRSQVLGVEGRATWTSTALGDSCLFLMRDNSLHTAFPFDSPISFNNHPPLLASSKKHNTRYAEWLLTRHGELCPGDEFYLMTDALSLWFLREHAAGNRPWEVLTDFGTKDSPPFHEWVGGLRDGDDKMNDDITLLRVYVESVE